jgi:hypothetical protein
MIDQDSSTSLSDVSNIAGNGPLVFHPPHSNLEPAVPNPARVTSSSSTFPSLSPELQHAAQTAAKASNQCGAFKRLHNPSASPALRLISISNEVKLMATSTPNNFRLRSLLLHRVESQSNEDLMKIRELNQRSINHLNAMSHQVMMSHQSRRAYDYSRRLQDFLPVVEPHEFHSLSPLNGKPVCGSPIALISSCILRVKLPSQLLKVELPTFGYLAKDVLQLASENLQKYNKFLESLTTTFLRWFRVSYFLDLFASSHLDLWLIHF